MITIHDDVQCYQGGIYNKSSIRLRKSYKPLLFVKETCFTKCLKRLHAHQRSISS